MPWVDDANASLLTDLYEITMAAAYHADGLNEPATFELWVRDLPGERNFLIAAGLDDALRHLHEWRFEPESISYLKTLDRFSDEFLGYLGKLSFEGEVWAVPEGTGVFAEEPLMRVTAPLIQGQLLETFLINAIGFQTMIASKAARVTLACGDSSSFVDFGARRSHGGDAALKAARAAYIGGAVASSMVLAGKEYGIPVTGTMAHSYVLAHHDEAKAFEAFARTFPDNAVFLIDTFDTREGARVAVEVAEKLAVDGIDVDGVRLDSGDLRELAVEVRSILDGAGLGEVKIFASGGLDEHAVSGLLKAGAPIDAFGVGTKLTTSDDAPSLDIVYKLVQDSAGPQMKTSSGKRTLPGVKQVFRRRDHDVIGLADEDLEGDPILEMVMEGGRRVATGPPVADIRSRALAAIDGLPKRLKQIEGPPPEPWPVEVSDALTGLAAELARARH